MADRASIKAEAKAHVAGDYLVFAHVVEAIGSGVARGIDHRRIGKVALFFTGAKTTGQPAGDVVVEIVLGTQTAKGVLGIGVGPALRHTLVGVRCRRHRHTGTNGDIRLASVHFMLLITQIGGDAQAIAAIVGAQRQQRQLARLTIHRRITITARHVQAHTDTIIGETAGKITRCVVLPARANTGGHFIQRLVGCPLGHNIDRAAQATATGRCTIEEGVGATQHFNPFDKFSAHVLARQEAVQAVIGNVVRINRQAAHHIDLLEVAKTARHAHRRVVQQHLANAGGLLVLNQGLGIAGSSERGIHIVLVTQDANP